MSAANDAQESADETNDWLKNISNGVQQWLAQGKDIASSNSDIASAVKRRPGKMPGFLT
jgi:hypothetical protein